MEFEVAANQSIEFRPLLNRFGLEVEMTRIERRQGRIEVRNEIGLTYLQCVACVQIFELFVGNRGPLRLAHGVVVILISRRH